MLKMWNMRVLIASLILILSAPFILPDAFGQGLGLGQTDLMRQLRETDAAMKDYAASHDHFPNCASEFDDCLKMLFKRVNLATADTTVTIQTNGKFHTYYQFAIAVDPSFMVMPVVNGVLKMPDYYYAPAGTVVILTDGGQNCMGWVAGNDGRPVVLQGGPIFFKQEIKKAEDSSGSP